MLLQPYTYRGSSFFLGKVTALGVLCCFALFVCLTLLASFFLTSHLSIKHVHACIHVRTLKSCFVFSNTCTFFVHVSLNLT